MEALIKGGDFSVVKYLRQQKILYEFTSRENIFAILRWITYLN